MDDHHAGPGWLPAVTSTLTGLALAVAVTAAGAGGGARPVEHASDGAVATPDAGTRLGPTRLDPARLPRGEDVAVAHVEGSTFVDGERRIDLGAPRATYVGRAGDAHVVATSSRHGNARQRIVRVEPDGSLRVLVEGVASYEVTLAEDGRRLVTAEPARKGVTRLRVRSARTGALLRSGGVRGWVSVLAMAGRRVVLSEWDRGTFTWTSDGRIRTVTSRPGGAAHVGGDLLASYTGDPYEGGCTVVSRLSRPGRVLWRSCDERVEDFSPDGRQMSTVHILADGIGPGRTWLRRSRGALVGDWTTTGWFGGARWESPGVLLLDTHARTLTATVRCDRTHCENATDPVPTEWP